MNATFLQIIVTLFGLVLAAFFTYFKFREPYRHELFKSKHDVYRLIHDTVGQLYFYAILCTDKMDTYGEALETTRYNLMIDLFQNELLISGEVLEMASEMARCSVEDVREDQEMWNRKMGDLANRMRGELKIGFIHDLPFFLGKIKPKRPLQ